VLFLAREYVERLMDSVPDLRTYLGALNDERALDTRMWLDHSGGAVEDDIEIELDL
jgi:hypothetical protein